MTTSPLGTMIPTQTNMRSQLNTRGMRGIVSPRGGSGKTMRLGGRVWMGIGMTQVVEDGRAWYRVKCRARCIQTRRVGRCNWHIVILVSLSPCLEPSRSCWTAWPGFELPLILDAHIKQSLLGGQQQQPPQQQQQAYTAPQYSQYGQAQNLPQPPAYGRGPSYQ